MSNALANRPAHLDYAEAGLDVLPIIPVGAKLIPESIIKPEMLGKIPGEFYRSKKGWAGVRGKWTQREFTRKDLERYGLDGAGVGLRCGDVSALDIDVKDPELVDAIRELAEWTLGPGPVRVGKPPKALIPYRTPGGLRGPRLFFEDASGTQHLVEWLGTGKQFVCEGIHPDTGKPYAWPEGDLPEAQLSEVTTDSVDAFFTELAQMLGAEHGCRITGAVSGAKGSVDVEVDPETLKAPDLDEAERLVRSIRNTDALQEITREDSPRGSWIRILYAIKGAFADDLDRAREVWLDFSSRWEDGEDDPEESLRDFEKATLPPRVGWDLLQRCARYTTPEERTRQAAEVFGGEDAEPLPEVEDEEEGQTRTQHMDRLVKRIGLLPSEKSVLYFDTRTCKAIGKEVANDRFARFFGTTSGARAFSNQFALRPDRLFLSGGQSYAPGKPAIFEHPVSGEMCANTYRPGPAHMPGGWASQPGGVSEEDIAIWLRLLERVVPDPDERFVMLNWMAWQVQRVGQKCNWGPLLRGEEGNGKDSLLLPLSLGLGGNCITLDYKTTIMSPYNDWIVGKSLILWGEIKGDKHLVNMMKQYMAAASDHDMLRISHKYVGGYEYPNVANHLLMSNYKDALQLTVNSRRVFVTDSGTDRGFPAEFYHEYRAWLDRGAPLVWRWLMDWNITVDMKGRAPASRAKEEMAYMTLSPLGHEIHRMIEEREGPCARDLVTVEEVADWAGVRLRGHKTGATPGGCGKVLGDMEGTEHFRLKVEGKTVRIWAVRNRERYQEMAQERGALGREWARQREEVPSRLAD